MHLFLQSEIIVQISNKGNDKYIPLTLNNEMGINPKKNETNEITGYIIKSSR